MSILGIENRTENWKTVEHFYGLSNVARAKLVHKLTGKTPSREIKLELFWKGFRDYAHQQVGGTPNPDDVTTIYESEFPELRARVESFRHPKSGRRFNDLKSHNYDSSTINRPALFSNLENTEIDVVLESEDSIFIGEAKHESKLKGQGKLILVHQLVREYVMATVLAHLVSKRDKLPVKTIVPFVVVDEENYKSVMETAQIGFMTSPDKAGRKWMSEKNVLTWAKIKELWP